jgi:hypothetical protein
MQPPLESHPALKSDFHPTTKVMVTPPDCEIVSAEYSHDAPVNQAVTPPTLARLLLEAIAMNSSRSM